MAVPVDARPYGRAEEFLEGTAPQALLKAHTTKKGLWALIHVLEARLAFRIEDPRRPGSDMVLMAATSPGVVAPTLPHAVAPLGPVRFCLGFRPREEN